MVSTDIIVGFPGETDEQFSRTLELIERVRPDITNITMFSARPGTAAKTMKGRVSTNVVKGRSRVLTDAVKRVRLEQNRSHVGKTYDIVVTEKGKEGTGTMMGRTESYRVVVFDGCAEVGSRVEVGIKSGNDRYLLGSVI
ncbi:MAG: hypothetical protein CVT48_00605 [Thermoplasmata archaeon HGW-Thermoplasmata-1]|nr:MAG: hypothetical protein CVT48_00605 [Thermoplasmata archaeon HGW-Thermoplasmata-1]